jgi:hypothetical protein
VGKKVVILKLFKNLPRSKETFFKTRPNQGGAIRTPVTSKQISKQFIPKK